MDGSQLTTGEAANVLRLVRVLAHRARGQFPWVDDDERRSAASWAIAHAVRTYRADRGTKLSTWILHICPGIVRRELGRASKHRRRVVLETGRRRRRRRAGRVRGGPRGGRGAHAARREGPVRAILGRAHASVRRAAGGGVCREGKTDRGPGAAEAAKGCPAGPAAETAERLNDAEKGQSGRQAGHVGRSGRRRLTGRAIG